MYYDENKPNYKVNVLGTEYKVYIGVPEDEDELFDSCNGYCDKTVKRIAIVGRREETELADWETYVKTMKRHELVHAFLFESGIDAHTIWDVPGEAHPEQMVQWIAVQFPKMLKAMQEIDAL